MRKIEFFLLFLTIFAVNFFLAIPCKAENFPKNYNQPTYQYPPQYYYPGSAEISYSNKGKLEVNETNTNIPNGQKPNKLEYQDPVAYPEASFDYPFEYN